MPTSTKKAPGTAEVWTQVGQRMHPKVRRKLKAVAALEGIDMEDYLHAVLCRELDLPELLDDPAPIKAAR